MIEVGRLLLSRLYDFRAKGGGCEAAVGFPVLLDGSNASEKAGFVHGAALDREPVVSERRFLEWIGKGKPSILGAISGAVAGLVAITPACVVAWTLAAAGTWVILRVCDALIGVRADEKQEIEGLDLSMHGEEGYNFEA